MPHLSSATQPSFPLVNLKSRNQDKNCYQCTGGPAPGIQAQPCIPSCLSSRILDDAVRADCRNSHVCGIDGIPWGQAGAGLPDEMQLDQQSLPQAGSIHHHHWCVQFLLPRLNFCSACPYPPFCPPLWISAGLPRSQREPGTVCSPMSCLLSEVGWSVKVMFQSGYLDQATWVPLLQDFLEPGS